MITQSGTVKDTWSTEYELVMLNQNLICCCVGFDGEVVYGDVMSACLLC